MFSLLIIFYYYHLLCFPHQYACASSSCDQKKSTLHRNLFKNLNFKNIAIFLKEHVEDSNVKQYDHKASKTTQTRNFKEETT